jgi:hypothetical protein
VVEVDLDLAGSMIESQRACAVSAADLEQVGRRPVVAGRHQHVSPLHQPPRAVLDLAQLRQRVDDGV